MTKRKNQQKTESSVSTESNVEEVENQATEEVEEASVEASRIKSLKSP